MLQEKVAVLEQRRNEDRLVEGNGKRVGDRRSREDGELYELLKKEQFESRAGSMAQGFSNFVEVTMEEDLLQFLHAQTALIEQECEMRDKSEQDETVVQMLHCHASAIEDLI